MSKITIIGAGKTGRGFLARLLNGNEITFIDKNKELVEKLNEQKTFEVAFFGNKQKSVNISYNAAYTWEQIGEIDAELILVSVGGSNLADVGRELSKRIEKGQRIIVCENASKPAQKLYDAIGIEGVMISESTVFCTTIENGGININSEIYPYLQFDAEPMRENLPQIAGLKPVFEFGNFLTRKLYTYNSASCVIAYLGAFKGFTVYSDAANDEEILSLLDKNYEITNIAMCKEFGYEEDDQKEFALLSRAKFTDKTIVDTVARNAREPQRKIADKERIVGILKLQAKYGLDTSVLEKTLAAALLYKGEGEEAWEEIISKGYEDVLSGLCGLDKGSDIYNRVLNMAQTKNIL